MHAGARPAPAWSGRPTTDRRGPPVGILVVCTANQCRSPVAAALLEADLAGAGVAASVTSAGLFGGGHPVPEEVGEVARARGLDLSGHRSREVQPEDVRRADLVLGMTREHVREMVVRTTEAWPRAFTLPEVVRRARRAGPRPAEQSLLSWLGEVHDGRRHSDLLGSATDDEVADPMGGPAEGYSRMADELAALSAQLVALAWPPARRNPGEEEAGAGSPGAS